jgi:hypothetical protein
MTGAPFVQRTSYEICRFISGKLQGQPIPVATLQEAKEEAQLMARGNLLDNKGTRAPSLPVYELDVDEALGHDAPAGLYIKAVTTRTEASVF